MSTNATAPAFWSWTCVRGIRMASRAVVTDACSVPVSEIITVEETDSHGKQYGSGKWQKMEKPFAFTGDGARVSSPATCSSDRLLIPLWVKRTEEWDSPPMPPGVPDWLEERRAAGTWGSGSGWAQGTGWGARGRGGGAGPRGAGWELTCPSLCSAPREESPAPPLAVCTGDFLLCRRAAVPPVAADPSGAAGEAEYVSVAMPRRAEWLWCLCLRVLACVCMCARACACCRDVGFRPPSHSACDPAVGGTSQ